jgi:hypothetical protein
MSPSRDLLLFSIVLMLWAVQIEASGYGSPGLIVLAALGLGMSGLVGSFLSSLTAVSHNSDSDPSK